MVAKECAHAHLRVRLAAQDKQFLADMSTRDGARPNISRAVKELIEKERKGGASVEVQSETIAVLDKLASALRRQPSQVVEDALQAIADMVEGKRLPLIVMELRLVKKYLDPAPGPSK